MRVFLVDACLHAGIEEYGEGELFYKESSDTSKINVFPTKPQPPLAFLYFYPILRGNGFKTFYLSLKTLIREGSLSVEGFYNSWEQFVRNLGPGIFAFTTNAQYYPTVINLSLRCKNASTENIVIHGGPQATAVGRKAMEVFDCIDYVVLGEGEYRFLELLNCITSNNRPVHLDGVLYRDGKMVKRGEGTYEAVDLDTLPLPYYGLAPPEHYVEDSGKQHVLIETTRGCPHDCKFCTASRSRFRTKSVSRVMQEVRHAVRQLALARQITFTSNLLLKKETEIEQFCNAYRNSNINLPWGCFARIDRMKPDLLQTMKLAGCKVIHYGLETGSPEMQKIINKRINLNTALETVKNTLDSGICPVVNFIIGFPEETEETINDTLDLMARLKILGAKIYPTILSPHNGTQYFYKYQNSLEFNTYRWGEIFFSEDYELIKSLPQLFAFYYYIVPDNIPIHQLEDLYVVLINQLLLVYPELIRGLAKQFNDNYLQLCRVFNDFLGSCGAELDGQPGNQRTLALLRQFTDRLRYEPANF